MVVIMKQHLNFGRSSFNVQSELSVSDELEFTNEAIEELFIRAVFGDQILDMTIEDWTVLNSSTHIDTLLYAELMRKYGL
jgi:hypothetical protein